MPGVFLLVPGSVFADPNQQVVQSNETLTASGSSIFTGYGAAEISLFINVKDVPTGTLPTLQYSIQEVDPGDGVTVIGPTVTSAVITAVGIQRITMESAFGGAIQVTWTVTGTTPSFTQVYATLVAKQASVKITDGVSTAGVKPASTAAVATDPAMVVAVSPNNTISVSIPSVGVVGAAVPASATQAGGSDGINLQTPRVFDADTGGGTEYVQGAVLRKTASGGSVEAGTAADPLRVDPTGTTTQPVSGVKTNDGAAPVADNLGAMVAVAASTVPAYTEGRQVLLSATLGGELRTVTSLSPETAMKEIAFGKLSLGGGSSGKKFPVYQTPYTEPPTQAQRSLASSSAADSAAGTGARQVEITYVNDAMTGQFTEIVTLNGLTPVNTVATDIRFIQKMRVVSVGSGGQNAGTISLYTGLDGAGTVIGTIGTGVGRSNQTYWAHHYVLDGETAVIVTFNAGVAGGSSAEAFLSMRNPLDATAPQLQITDSITVAASAATTPRVVPNTVAIVGPAFMVMEVIPTGNNASYFGSFDFWED